MLNAIAAVLALLLEITVLGPSVTAQTVKPSWQADWEKTIELAKREGKVVVSIPASSELRAELEKHFEKRYGVDVEPVVGRAPTVVRKMADEAKAGVRYIDLHMGGSESVVTGLLPEGVLRGWAITIRKPCRSIISAARPAQYEWLKPWKP